MHKGSCLCGAVTFELEGDLRAPDACHCSKCRKQSGHFFASTDVPRRQIAIQGGESVTWFQSSEKVRRGLLSLFWDPPDHDWIAVAMGAFDGPTETKLKMHIYSADKGDYYDITDNLPQNAQ
ncbi:GFA family protein [Rhizobium laguerreae]|uniref:GFA family protein n=1 Tax=Rhizobium laguerreae TaxID=1076926 RepID=UPI001C91DDDE|nr:GFA family protein [Rhizobium laguerreae]MBY3190328.1 GFA family protein [Rhizobium laguerreae]